MAGNGTTDKATPKFSEALKLAKRAANAKAGAEQESDDKTRAALFLAAAKSISESFEITLLLIEAGELTAEQARELLDILNPGA